MTTKLSAGIGGGRLGGAVGAEVGPVGRGAAMLGGRGQQGWEARRQLHHMSSRELVREEALFILRNFDADSGTPQYGHFGRVVKASAC